MSTDKVAIIKGYLDALDIDIDERVELLEHLLALHINSTMLGVMDSVWQEHIKLQSEVIDL